MRDPVDIALAAAAGIFRGRAAPWDQRRALRPGWRARPDAEVFDAHTQRWKTVPSLLKNVASEECWDAAQRGDSFKVAQLIDEGADPDWRAPVYGRPTAAHAAVLSQARPFTKVMVLKRLAAAGCNLNAKLLEGPKKGMTPLALANERRFEPEPVGFLQSPVSD